MPMASASEAFQSANPGLPPRQETRPRWAYATLPNRRASYTTPRVWLPFWSLERARELFDLEQCRSRVTLKKSIVRPSWRPSLLRDCVRRFILEQHGSSTTLVECPLRGGGFQTLATSSSSSEMC